MITPRRELENPTMKGQAQMLGSRAFVRLLVAVGCVLVFAGSAAATIGAAASAQAAGVRTFVIGSPGSEGARESLSRMAEAGGTAQANCSHRGPNYCHFDMTQQSDLAAGLDQALSAIAGLALGCSYDIPQPPLGALPFLENRV